MTLIDQEIMTVPQVEIEVLRAENAELKAQIATLEQERYIWIETEHRLRRGVEQYQMDIADCKRMETYLRRMNRELEQWMEEHMSELQRNRMLLQQIVDNLPAAVFAKDLQGNFLLMNQACKSLLGSEREEMLDKNQVDLFPPEFVARWRSIEQEVLATSSTVHEEEIYPLSDGTHTLASSLFPLRDSEGEIYAFGGIVLDVTKHKDTEADFENFYTLAENSPDGMALARSDGTIIYANPAYRALTGYGDALVGMGMVDLCPKEDQTKVAESLGQRGGRVLWQGTRCMCRKDGTLYHLEMTTFPIPTGSPTPQMFGIVVRDTLDQRYAGEDLAEPIERRATLQARFASLMR